MTKKLYTHIYNMDKTMDIPVGAEEPMMVAEGTRINLIGRAYTPPNIFHDKYPGAYYEVVEYNSYLEWQLGTTHIKESWYEDAMDFWA
mgnify:CR=1 FL=1